MRGVALISAVVFIAITISAMALVYQLGVPIIQSMQNSASLDRMSQSLSELDRTIQRVASEGNGSRRIIDIDSGQGRLSVDPDSDTMTWRLDSENAPIRPRSAKHQGNLAWGSNLYSSLEETSFQGKDAYLLENEYLEVYILKMDSAQSYHTGDLLLGMYQKDLSEWLPFQSLNLSLDDEESSKSGTGYTEPERIGKALPRAMVTAYMDSVYSNYLITFRLESGSDFIIIEAEAS